jgi:hypothetical protein
LAGTATSAARRRCWVSQRSSAGDRQDDQRPGDPGASQAARDQPAVRLHAARAPR